MKKWFLAILLICSISFITACGNDDNAPDEDDQIKQNDVVEQDPVNDDDFDDNDDDRDENDDDRDDQDDQNDMDDDDDDRED